MNATDLFRVCYFAGEHDKTFRYDTYRDGVVWGEAMNLAKQIEHEGNKAIIMDRDGVVRYESPFTLPAEIEIMERRSAGPLMQWYYKIKDKIFG